MVDSALLQQQNFDDSLFCDIADLSLQKRGKNIYEEMISSLYLKHNKTSRVVIEKH